MCAEAKTNRVSLVSPDPNGIEQSGDTSGSVQCHLGIFDSFRLLSIKNGRGFPRTVCCVTCFWFGPRYEAVIGAGEGHVCFWTNITRVN